MIVNPTPYSCRPLVSPDCMVVIRSRALDAASSIRHNFEIYDRREFKGGRPVPNAIPLTSGVGFATAESRDQAVRVASRRVQGLPPAAADPVHTTAECRAILAHWVEQTWGR